MGSSFLESLDILLLRVILRAKLVEHSKTLT
jgi:hypothetical protein